MNNSTEPQLPEWLQKWPATGRSFDERHPEVGYSDAIEVAAVKGDIEALRCILREIPDALGLCTMQEESVLYLAAKFGGGQVAFVDYVMNHGGKSFNLMNYPQKQGKTPLWAAIYRSGSLPMIKLLLVHGASLGATQFAPIAEFKWKTQVKDFLQPLREWLVKMKAKHAAKPQLIDEYSLVDDSSLFLKQVSNKRSCFYSYGLRIL